MEYYIKYHPAYLDRLQENAMDNSHESTALEAAARAAAEIEPDEDTETEGE